MIPGMNPKQMRQAMKKMGVEQDEIPADQVIIKSGDKNIIFDNPQVAEVNMMGQSSFQITGEYRIEEIDSTPDISDEDVETVASQTGKSKDEAKAAIEKHKGDLAEAILELSGE